MPNKHFNKSLVNEFEVDEEEKGPYILLSGKTYQGDEG
jgi:hypothetical protein